MLEKLELGGANVVYEPAERRALLSLPATPAGHYANAQLDNYHTYVNGRPRRLPLSSSAPVRVSLRARASHAAPVGTLGFGFWNEPFSVRGSVLSTPNVVWFFYASPPSDMALVAGVPGRGWKAATLNTGRMPRLLLAPAALGAIALIHVPGLGRPVMRLARRFVRAHEAPLADVQLHEWHSYELDWRPEIARFSVDGVERLAAPAPSAIPLGFVLWIDNQYAIASERGQFGFGILPVIEPQWLEIDALHIDV
jgi:hypothetical protein